MIAFTDYPTWAAQPEDQINDWLNKIAKKHGRRISNLRYSFLNDDAMQNLNRAYLNHDYPTDIITFGYEEGTRLAGEVFIGVETVQDNAETLALGREDELDRVIAHGLLHLIGFDDQTEDQKARMRREEDKCLVLRPKNLNRS